MSRHCPPSSRPNTACRRRWSWPRHTLANRARERAPRRVPLGTWARRGSRLLGNHQREAVSGRGGDRHVGWPRARHIRKAESCDYRVLFLLSVVELIIEDVGVDQWQAATRVVELAGSPFECELVIRIRPAVQHRHDEFVGRAVVVAGTEIVGTCGARCRKCAAQRRERATYEKTRTCRGHAGVSVF